MHEGGCSCGKVRYRLASDPIVVHCCHCTSCQRESGSSHAVNAVIESDRVALLGEAPELVLTPSESGTGQQVYRCPHCRVAVWSHYGGKGERASFIRVGTLDAPGACPPDVHIFTRSKQDWVILPEGVEVFGAFYDAGDVPRVYGEEGHARWLAL